MIAGAICEGNSCNSLVLFIFGVLAAIAIVITVVSVALMATVSAVLERRGWSKVSRRFVAGVVVGFGLLLVASAAMAASGDIASLVAAMVVLASVPMAIWQRRVTRRWRAATAPTVPVGTGQSSPCSTA